MPQPESAAAPPPVTPRILRNRLRFIASVIASPPPSLKMARRTVARHFALDVAPDAPSHLEGRHLGDLRLPGDVTVAVGTSGCVRAEHLDMTPEREMHEVGNHV